jgi:hypothetical protein
MSQHYVLVNGEVRPAELMEWAEWLENADRAIGRDVRNDVMVSTVFLGLDHSFGGSVPLLFETMIFGGEHDQHLERYSTLNEAKEGHARAVAMAFPE